VPSFSEPVRVRPHVDIALNSLARQAQQALQADYLTTRGAIAGISVNSPSAIT